MSEPDFASQAEDSTGSGGRYEDTSAAPGEGAGAKTVHRGFLLTIKCTSPNQGGPGFIDQQFNNYLRKLLPMPKVGETQPERPYKIERVLTVQSLHIKDDATLTAKLNAKCLDAASRRQPRPRAARRPLAVT